MSSLADFTPKEWECEAGGAGDRAFFLVAGTRLSDGDNEAYNERKMMMTYDDDHGKACTSADPDQSEKKDEFEGRLRTMRMMKL